ncbi:hypothetical protein DSL64_22225 [Dyadobacter luteus]|uniref:Uncharacterized protein n=2 Tax=Dyadobacter luteus TaxID=2259619 RepID=A0A3D8Y623_9BACT|nr:hypothetical protein DSL64_22225 [Dyadobacter luteus]
MGTQQINTTSRTSGGGAGYGGGFGGGFGSAHTRTTGTSQSIMAQQVAPPKKKEYMITALLVIAGLVTIFMIESALIGLLFVGLGGFLDSVLTTYKNFNFLYLCLKAAQSQPV